MGVQKWQETLCPSVAFGLSISYSVLARPDSLHFYSDCNVHPL